MKIFKTLKRSTRLKNFPDKRNEAVLDCMVRCGFPMSKIRQSLRVLNGVKLGELTNGRTTVVTACNTVAGRGRNMDVMAVLSDRLGVGVDRLFPGAGK